jgi:hypothetical protein
VTADAGATEPSAVEPSAAEAPDRAGGEAVAVPGWGGWIKSPVWADALAPTIALRVVLLVFGWLAVVVFRGDILRAASFLDIWNRWDGPHFLDIARWGYGPPSEEARIVLFPAFPYLIRALSWLMDPVVAGMLISFVASLAAAAGLYRLVRFDSGRVAARGAVVAMSLFPTAYALVAPYSEALFLAFAVWAFVVAREGKWRAAGVLALLAGLTRVQGVFIVPALLVEYWLSRRRIGLDAAWLLVGLGGPLLYLALNYVTFGDALHFLDVQQRMFFVRTVAPWVSIPEIIGNATRFEATENWVTVYLAPAVGLGILAVVTLWTAFGRGGRWSYFVYSALTLGTFLILSWPISVPRYLMGVFPIFIAAGHAAVRPWVAVALFAASTLLLGMFATLFLIGHWAF